jgi:16S rRNA (adenine1518-N6/adenine1519-N6)-dimethyltransferase
LLLKEAGEVLAIEKDARLVEVLRERFRVGQTSRLSLASVEMETGATPVLRVIHADALELVREKSHDWSGWKLVSNLPYSVASPILVELAQSPRRPERMVVTLQLEVARRLIAKSGDTDYGVLTLLVQLNFEPRESFKIPAGCFFPQPDVDSACVVLLRRSSPLLPEELHATFARIVKRAFSQRRKMMQKLLKADWPLEQLQAVFTGLGISPLERAEKLSLEQFVALTQALVKRDVNEN